MGRPISSPWTGPAAWWWSARSRSKGRPGGQGPANGGVSIRSRPNAREFVQRRIDAARHYDLAQSLVGMRRPIYPQGREADAILAAAAKTGVYRLAPRKSVAGEPELPLVDAALL